MNKKELNKEKIWNSLFMIIPIIISLKFSEPFFESGISRIVASGLLAAIGAGIGISVYSVVKQKSAFIKTISLVLIFFVGIAGFILINNTAPNKATCEICGYIAIDKENTACDNCISDTWNAFDAKEEYKNKEEWVKEEQLFWFSTDSFNDSLFYTPYMVDSFIKDKNWKPSITADDIIEYEESETKKPEKHVNVLFL